MKHIWSVLCKKSVVDKESNSLSLWEVLEQIKVTVQGKSSVGEITMPMNLPMELHLVSFWVRKEREKKGEREIDMRLELYDPNDKELSSFSHKVVVPEDKKRMRTIIKIAGLKITTPGEYLLKVMDKEAGSKKYKTVAEIPLEVILGIEKNVSPATSR